MSISVIASPKIIVCRYESAEENLAVDAAPLKVDAEADAETEEDPDASPDPEAVPEAVPEAEADGPDT